MVQHGRGAVVAMAPTRLVVQADVPRRLLQVARESPPLEDLGQDVGRAFDRDVRAAELGDRVVAIFGQYPVVERGRPLLAGVGGGAHGRAVRRQELVDQQASQRLGAAAVAGEKRALDDLGQVGQREDRPDGVGDVGGEPLAFLGGQVVCAGHPAMLPGVVGRPENANGRSVCSGRSNLLMSARVRAR